MACTVKTNRHGYLARRLYWGGHESWEGTGLQATNANKVKLQRIAECIAAEIRARVFTPERYLHYFPAGNRAREFWANGAGPSSNLPTLREWFRVWIARVEADDTRRSRVRDYKQHWLGYVLEAMIDGVPLGDVPLNLLRVKHLKALRRRLHDRELSAKTIRNIVDGSFRAGIRDAREEFDEYDIGDPFAALKWPRRSTPPPDPFTEQERDARARVVQSA